MATIKDIAKLAEVSPTTVSRVLNQDETMVVSQEIKMKIFRIAHELKYVSPRMRHLQEKEKMIVGVADWHIVRPDRLNVHLASLNCIAESLSPKVKIEFVRMEKETSGRYDGIIAFGIFTEEEMERLRLQSVAVIFINSNDKDYQYDSIVMDFDRGIIESMEYLVNKRQYRSAGYIGGLYENGEVRIGYRRLKCVKETFAQYGCLDERNIYVGELSKESGYALAKEAMVSGHLPEALILGSDEIAEGAIEAFQEAGLRTPKDLAIVIYEDIKTLESKWKDFTRVQMFPDIVWETAIKLLLEQIHQRRTDSMKIFLPAKLKLGDSA
jgi:LacI family transcriptional regulator